MKQSSKTLTRKIAISAMLAAIGVILQMLEIPLPFIPSFIKLDFSDLPGFIGAFVCGPLAGVLITLIRNVIHIFMGSSAGIGELSNFILSASFVLTAGLIYKKMPNIKGVLIGGVAGAVIMGIVSFPVNNFIIYRFITLLWASLRRRYFRCIRQSDRPQNQLPKRLSFSTCLSQLQKV